MNKRRNWSRLQQSQSLDFLKTKLGKEGRTTCICLALAAVTISFSLTHHRYMAQHAHKGFHIIYHTIRPFSPDSPTLSVLNSFSKEYATENMTQCSKPAVEVSSSICNLAYTQESTSCTQTVWTKHIQNHKPNPAFVSHLKNTHYQILSEW